MTHKETILPIKDALKDYYGGNQYWFPKKTHQVNGCGPVAAANITAYLAKEFPEKYASLYAFTSLEKRDYIKHLIQIRKYIKPGVMGLISVTKFADQLKSYALDYNVSLIPHLDNEPKTLDEAITYINSGLSQKLPVAILILLHSAPQMSDYVWHWMTITGFYRDSITNIPYIITSTWGERRVIDFEILWNGRRKKDVVRLVYFT